MPSKSQSHLDSSISQSTHLIHEDILLDLLPSSTLTATMAVYASMIIPVWMTTIASWPGSLLLALFPYSLQQPEKPNVLLVYTSANIIPLSTARPPKPSSINENRSQRPQCPVKPHYSLSYCPPPPRHACFVTLVRLLFPATWPCSSNVHTREHLMVWKLTFLSLCISVPLVLSHWDHCPPLSPFLAWTISDLWFDIGYSFVYELSAPTRMLAPWWHSVLLVLCIVHRFQKCSGHSINIC